MINIDTIVNHDIDEFFENYPTIEDYIEQSVCVWYEPGYGYDDNSCELAAEYKQMLKLAGEKK